MPGLNGVELLERTANVPEILYRFMITGLCDFSIIHAALNRAGVNRYLTKPWQSDDLLNTLREAAEQARLRLENQELQRRLEARNRELGAINQALGNIVRERTADVLNALIAALDYRDTETQWHSRRVALFSRMLGAQLGLDQRELQNIELGALLHDIGKIGISDTILLKPGKLTEEEWVQMRQHPRLGHQLLEGIDFLSEARVTVLHHHERWDGQGYPDGLARHDINLGARVFAVCDTLDAITSDRPYRKARPLQVAVEEIQRCSGSQFDPRVVDAFMQVGAQRCGRAIEIGHLQERQQLTAKQLSAALHSACQVLPELTQTYAWQPFMETQHLSLELPTVQQVQGP
jgi:response regulator RpfG family c-di-GMP phosphodiesterase